MKIYDVIIIGAGAAGLMCAAQSAKRGRKTLLLDHANKAGEKIRISGGGRCNFTNINASPANFISENPRFCVSALSRYTQLDFLKLVESYNIAYHEKTLGQLFCDGSSQQIIDMLIAECNKYSAEIQLSTHINDVSKIAENFQIKTSNGDFNCSSLVIATGGKSIPKMGATGFGYDIAEKFGLKIIETSAALVPFTFENEMLLYFKSLAGVAVSASVKCNKKQFDEAILFTHRGLSGPAILQISSYWKAGDKVELNLKPQQNVLDFLKAEKAENPRQEIATILSKFLPKNLAQTICEDNKLSGRIADSTNEKFNQIAQLVHNWQVIPEGTEGYRTAEVTLGGVDTNELSSKTFEANKVKGLYFIGEVVDVTGHLGGYNFQWAWSSGHAAGQFV
jgi:predicted Rossmann fold flavoprotein